MASAMWSSSLVLTVIFHISKELQSSARAHFCSDLMISSLCPHTSWQLSLILIKWASVQMFVFAQFTGCPYPPSILLMSSLYGHFICVWTCDAVSRGCVQIRVSHIFPWWVRVQWGINLSAPWASCSYPVIGISDGPGWTGRGLAGSCPLCSVLGPASGTNLGVISLPPGELCLSQPLPLGMNVDPPTMMIAKTVTGRMVPFFLWRAQRMGAHEGSAHKRISAKKGTMGGGVSIRWVGLLEGPRMGGSSCSGAAMMAWASLLCHAWMQMHHPCSKGGCWRKCTKAIAWLNWPNWSSEKPLGQWCVLPEPFVPTSTHVFSPAWSTDLHIYKLASESPHSACIF